MHWHLPCFVISRTSLLCSGHCGGKCGFRLLIKVDCFTLKRWLNIVYMFVKKVMVSLWRMSTDEFLVIVFESFAVKPKCRQRRAGRQWNSFRLCVRSAGVFPVIWPLKIPLVDMWPPPPFFYSGRNFVKIVSCYWSKERWQEPRGPQRPIRVAFSGGSGAPTCNCRAVTVDWYVCHCVTGETRLSGLIFFDTWTLRNRIGQGPLPTNH